jgi:hypothetical protein
VRLQRAAPDRYQSLIRALRAGREVPWQHRRPGSLEWHPIAWVLVRVIAAVALIYLAVTTGMSVWRDQRVDTWSGPDATVTSGQRLEGCPAASEFRDAIFPAWVRFGGSIYGGTSAIRPVGSNADNAYPVTGYHLGSLGLLQVANEPEGQAGRMILLKLDSSLTGQVYVRLLECE